MRPTYILPDWVTTFSDYFKLNVETDELLATFGYQFAVQQLTLPRSTDPVAWAEPMRERLKEMLLLTSLSNETARRELLISPILQEVSRYLRSPLRIEYMIHAGPRLQGTLDYLLVSGQQLLIVEAKQGDTTHGFNQMAIELIALDQWTESPVSVLYAVLSTGKTWQFAQLNRRIKLLTQDIYFFPIPENLPELAAVLTGILTTPGELTANANSPE